MASRVLIVIPAFNEGRSVATVVAAVVAAGWDCLVVDDGSADNTASVASASGARVVSHATNLGVGAAIRTGFKYAVDHGYDRVVQCDADGQHRVDLILELVRTAEESGADLVIGSRFLNPDPTSMAISEHRLLAMRWLSWLLRVKTKVEVKDTTSGFKCTSQPLLSQFARSFPAHFLGDTFEACLVAANNGYRIVEIPAIMNERAHGQSSASPLRAVQYIIRSLAAAILGLTFRIQPRASASVA